MTEYKDLPPKSIYDLTLASSAELGALGNGILIDYETGQRYQFDQDTAMFLASARTIVLHLIHRLYSDDELNETNLVS